MDAQDESIKPTVLFRRSYEDDILQSDYGGDEDHDTDAGIPENEYIHVVTRTANIKCSSFDFQLNPMKLQLIMSVVNFLGTLSQKDFCSALPSDADEKSDQDAKSSDSDSVCSDGNCEYLGIFPTRCGDYCRAGIVQIVLGRYVAVNVSHVSIIWHYFFPF